MKPSTNPHGYKIVNLSFNGKAKGFAVHNLVARAFVDGYMPGLQVNHIDGNKGNNNANNLEWVTPLENVRHSFDVLGLDMSGASNPNARCIYGYDKNSGELLYKFDSIIDAGRKFANNDEKKARAIQNIICQVASGNHGRKSYRGCVWSYEQIPILRPEDLKDFLAKQKRKWHRAHNRKLSDDSVREIKTLLNGRSISQSELARKFDVSKTIIQSIASGRTYIDVE